MAIRAGPASSDHTPGLPSAGVPAPLAVGPWGPGPGAALLLVSGGFYKKFMCGCVAFLCWLVAMDLWDYGAL